MFTECYLGKETLNENALGEKIKGISYCDDSIYCEEKSVKMSEYYQAMQTGLKAEKIISVNKYEYYAYYDDEELKKFVKVRHTITNKLIEYMIVRTYEKDDDNIELTLSRGVENVGA